MRCGPKRNAPWSVTDGSPELLEEDPLPLAAFALSLALQQAPAAPPAGIAPGTQDPKELFTKAKCVTCHGEDGRGDTDKGRKLKAPDFTSAKWSEETTDKEIRDTIRKGTKDKKGNVRMPAFRKKLTPEQIEQLSAYVRTFIKR
jgi:mono/diheme cytochrome c family protein